MPRVEGRTREFQAIASGMALDENMRDKAVVLLTENPNLSNYVRTLPLLKPHEYRIRVFDDGGLAVTTYKNIGDPKALKPQINSRNLIAVTAPNPKQAYSEKINLYSNVNSAIEDLENNIDDGKKIITRSQKTLQIIDNFVQSAMLEERNDVVQKIAEEALIKMGESGFVNLSKDSVPLIVKKSQSIINAKVNKTSNSLARSAESTTEWVNSFLEITVTKMVNERINTIPLKLMEEKLLENYYLKTGITELEKLANFHSKKVDLLQTINSLNNFIDTYWDINKLQIAPYRRVGAVSAAYLFGKNDAAKRTQIRSFISDPNLRDMLFENKPITNILIDRGIYSEQLKEIKDRVNKVLPVLQQTAEL